MSLPRFEKALLDRAVVREGPDPERRAAAKRAVLRAAAAAVAAGAATTAVTTSATAATGAGATGGVGAGAAGATTATTAGAVATSAKLLTVAKLVVVAAIGLGGAGTAVVVATRAHDVRPVATAPTAAANANANANTNTNTNATEAVPSVAIGDLPSVPAHETVTASGSPVAPSDPLASEARLLESARACLRVSDTACARARLRDHAMQFPTGALTEEAEVLAIDVARADADKTHARELAASFVRHHPASPYTPRVRAVLRDLAE